MTRLRSIVAGAHGLTAPVWLVPLATCIIALLVAAAWVGADTVTLTDGTVYEGSLKKIGSTYQIVTEDGQYKFVPESKIASINGAALGAGGTTGADAAGSAAPRVGLGEEFKETKTRADRSDEPVRAVSLWDEFLARQGLSAIEKEEAEKERSRWNKLYADGAEKVRGDWMGGEELKKIKDEAAKLVDDAIEMEENGQVLDAVRSYREAVRVYPNSFRAHYRLSYIKFKEGAGQAGGNKYLREAERHGRAALRLEPELPAVLSSMGACLFVLRNYEEGIEYMWRAVQTAETEVTVGNLLTALAMVPDQWIRNNRTLREINLNANYLRSKYRGGGALLFIVDYTHGVEDMNPEDDPDMGPPGLQGNGSGFFITPDGYLLTNKHVAETNEGFYYRVRLDGKDDEGGYVEYNARLIATDEKFDVALLKVDLPEGETVPYLHVLPEDFPPDAAQVMVLGYPATGTENKNMQIAVGTVKSNNEGEDYEVWFDLSTTHGNSGGPIVDRNGNVVGILSGGRTVFNVTYVLGVGPGQIREFFERIGDKAPQLDYGDVDQPFNSESLARQCRPATLLVLIFRGDLETDAPEGEIDPEDAEQAADSPEDDAEGPAVRVGAGVGVEAE